MSWEGMRDDHDCIKRRGGLVLPFNSTVPPSGSSKHILYGIMSMMHAEVSGGL